MKAGEIARLLARRIDVLAPELLPGGHREGHEWRAGSVAGEGGNSLGVHLTGQRAGVWADFSTGQKGDALDLVAAVLDLEIGEAMTWSRRWLGIEEGEAPRPVPPPAPSPATRRSSNFWRRSWDQARPISGTIAESYLTNRGLHFNDPAGEVLRFAKQHARRNPAGELEHHTALLALLRNIRSGEACGVINVYLQTGGIDRIRDARGKTSWGRAGGSAVMLDGFEDVTLGLTICEGTETGIALSMGEQRPVWCCGGAGNLSTFPVLDGIEALTIAADAGDVGQQAANTVSRRWQAAGRETVIITPIVDDWAARKAASS